MYYAHFGLDQAPFRITPNTDFFFGGGNRGAILEALMYAIMQGEGIVKVTGEVGSGKTMLCNMLQARLPPHIETVYLAHPNVAPDEILHAVAFELQLGMERAAPRIELMHRLQAHLLKRHAEGKRVVMFVEESQSMPLATLEEMRLLSNLETRNDKLLQIVMFGQPELDDNLRDPGIRQLKERITHSFRLGPLDAAETREYLMFRLRAAGYRGPELFSAAVIRRIVRASRGLTRRINLIADKALMAAFSENTHTIKATHVKAAARDSAFGEGANLDRRPRVAWAMTLLLAGALGGALTYAWIAGYETEDAQVARNAMSIASEAAGLPREALPAGERAPPAKAYGADTPPSTGGSDSRPDTVAAPEAVEAQNFVGSSLIEQRFAATREWLADAAPTMYSIQLMGIEDETLLKQHLNDIAKFIEVHEVFLYRTVAKRKTSLTVLYGSFRDRQAAQDALEGLPSALKANRPLLRTVRGIRTEIMRHRSS